MPGVRKKVARKKAHTKGVARRWSAEVMRTSDALEKNLTPERRRVLNDAKQELRDVFHRTPG